MRPARASAPVFAVVWALSHIVHIWHQDEHLVAVLPASTPNLIALGAATYVLLQPRSAGGLAFLAAAQLAAFFMQFPFVANHWTIAAFVNAGILVSFAAGRARIRDNATLVGLVAPYARVVFLISYGAAAIAKLNETFLTPTLSCAVSTLESINQFLNWEVLNGDWAQSAVVWAVAGTELLIPVLLLVPVTRLFGIAVAVLFHLSLAITPVVVVMDFTLLVIALALLFAPSDFDERVAADVQRFRERRPSLAKAFGTTRPLLTLMGLAWLVSGAVLREWAFGESGWAVVSWITFTVVGVLVAVVTLATLGTYLRSRDSVRGSLYHLTVAQALLVVLVAANALSPYIGWKTTSSFTMFSNLATENGQTNHLFMPRLGLGGFQDDLVKVVDTDDAELRQRTEDGQWVAMHEFRRRLTANPTASVTYVRNNEAAVTLADASEAPHLVSQSWWEAKILHFRPVAPNGHPICQP